VFSGEALVFVTFVGRVRRVFFGDLVGRVLSLHFLPLHGTGSVCPPSLGGIKNVGRGPAGLVVTGSSVVVSMISTLTVSGTVAVSYTTVLTLENFVSVCVSSVEVRGVVLIELVEISSSANFVGVDLSVSGLIVVLAGSSFSSSKLGFVPFPLRISGNPPLFGLSSSPAPERSFKDTCSEVVLVVCKVVVDAVVVE